MSPSESLKYSPRSINLRVHRLQHLSHDTRMTMNKMHLEHTHTYLCMFISSRSLVSTANGIQYNWVTRIITLVISFASNRLQNTKYDIWSCCLLQFDLNPRYITDVICIYYKHWLIGFNDNNNNDNKQLCVKSETQIHMLTWNYDSYS